MSTPALSIGISFGKRWSTRLSWCDDRKKEKTMTPEELVKALKNALSENMPEMNKQFSAALQPIVQRQQELEKQQKLTEERLGGVENRVSNLENRLSNIDNRLSNIESHLIEIQRKTIEVVENSNTKTIQAVRDAILNS